MIDAKGCDDQKEFRPRLVNEARATKVAGFFGFLSNLARGKFKNDKARKGRVPEPRTNLLFNSMCTAEETTLHHGIWGNDGDDSNTMRHSWKIIAILVELVNERLRPGEEALPVPQIFEFLDGIRAAEHGGVLSSAEVAENCGARASEDGGVALAAGQDGGQGVLSAEADDVHELAAEGGRGIDFAHDMEIDQDDDEPADLAPREIHFNSESQQ